MNDARSLVALRPLGVGEILDRAVTLYVRYWAPLAIVSCALAVPTAVLQFIELAHHISIFTTTAGSPTLSPSQIADIALPTIVILMMQPFVYVAATALTGQIYRSETPDWRSAYARTFRHTLGIILCILTGIGVYLGVAFGFSILLIGSVALLPAFRGPGPSVVLVVGGVIVLIALVYLVFLLFFAIAMALTALGAENTGATSALSSSFKTILNRREVGKATLVGLAWFAVTIAVAFVNAGVQMLLASLHVPLVAAAIAGLVSLVVIGFGAVTLTVYHFDIRVRRDGLDVQAALESLPPAAQT